MMPQMEGQQSSSERSSDAYGSYRGSSDYNQQSYETTYQVPPASNADDSLAENISQRVAQRMQQGSTGKVHGSADRLTPEQRTGLGIVSVIAFIPLGIVLGQQGPTGIISLGIIGLVIFLINAVANGAHKGLW